MPGSARARDVDQPAGSDQQAGADRLVSLGATRTGIGRGDADRVVMADPGGHGSCVLAPR